MVKEGLCWRLKSLLEMWIMCSMIGLIHLLQSTVCGGVFPVITSPLMWLHCEYLILISQNYVILVRL